MEPGHKRVVRVGSRNSQLALIQTNHVIDRLKELNPETEYDITTMLTLGDKILNISLPKIGEKSLFTRELEDALAKKTVDMIVHSLKDLPTTLPNGMAIGAILEREDPRDALVLREDLKGHTLETLPSDSVIGTSSLRRTAQLAKCFPHLRVVDIRGNLNTRLNKLDRKVECFNSSGRKEEYSALILAAAGLIRMGWNDRISQVLPCSTLMYAVGQGALAIECRSDDEEMLKMLSVLSDSATYCRALAERSFLKTLGGGCSAPVAVSTSLKKYSKVDGHGLKLKISGSVWSLDGKLNAQNALECTFSDYQETSSDLAASGKHKLSEDDNREVKKTKSIHDILSSPVSNCEGSASTDKPDVCTKKFTGGVTSCCARNNKTIDIENLINVQGKLYISCPYSSNDGLCPFDLPIGSDFMAKCPYFDPEKGTLDGDVIDKIKHSAREKQKLDISQCPFMSSTSSSASHAKCPKAKCGSCNAVKLYCGLTKHFGITTEIVEKCETLGYDLAQSLVKQGALDIMKSAQDYIHSFHGNVKK